MRWLFKSKDFFIQISAHIHTSRNCSHKHVKWKFFLGTNFPIKITCLCMLTLRCREAMLWLRGRNAMEKIVNVCAERPRRLGATPTATWNVTTTQRHGIKFHLCMSHLRSISTLIPKGSKSAHQAPLTLIPYRFICNLFFVIKTRNETH